MSDTPKLTLIPAPGLERRVLALDVASLQIEERGDGQSPMIHGYAAVFNRLSDDLGGFREKLSPGCFDRCLKRSDVRALVNHDPSLLLGRLASGTLRLRPDNHGLRAEIDPPNTALARHYVEAIRRGDMSGMSFAFTVAKDGARVEQQGGEYVRSVDEIDELFDVGPVTYPAYEDTRVAVRSVEAFRATTEPESILPPEIRAEPDINRRLRLALAWAES